MTLGTAEYIDEFNQALSINQDDDDPKTEPKFSTLTPRGKEITHGPHMDCVFYLALDSIAGIPGNSIHIFRVSLKDVPTDAKKWFGISVDLG